MKIVDFPMQRLKFIMNISNNVNDSSVCIIGLGQEINLIHKMQCVKFQPTDLFKYSICMHMKWFELIICFILRFIESFANHLTNPNSANFNASFHYIFFIKGTQVKRFFKFD